MLCNEAIHTSKHRKSTLNELRECGKIRQEIAEELGLTKIQVKNWIERYNRRMRKNTAGIPKSRDRKPAVTLAEYKYEVKRLRMENEILRDFLQLAGRR